MAPVRFGIVGCGAISQAHVYAITHTEEARLAAVVDISAERAQRLAEVNGCQWFTSVEDMLEQAAIDAVAVCTASGSHMEPAIAAANAGKHLIIEKPLEVTPERCDAIVSACARNGVLLSGVLQSRFMRANKLVKQAVDSGLFGRLLLGNAEVKWFREKDYYTGSGWRGTWRYDGGGALMNQGIHQVDLLQWMMGPVTAVQAVTRRLVHTGIEVEDLAVAILQFASGAVGVLEASTGIAPGYPKRLEIHGASGGAIVEDDVLLKSTGIPDDADLQAAMLREGECANYATPMAISFAGHQMQYADFVDAVIHEHHPQVTGEDACQAVKIITAVYESARTGTAVSL